MAMVKSITATDEKENWIQEQMVAGHYGTDSELIREALREKHIPLQLKQSGPPSLKEKRAESVTEPRTKLFRP